MRPRLPVIPATTPPPTDASLRLSFEEAAKAARAAADPGTSASGDRGTVADAELRAQKIVHQAHVRVTEILEELRDAEETLRDTRSKPQGKLRVDSIDMAFDSGRVLNRDAVVAQLEGGAIMALNMAMLEKISIKDGKVVELFVQEGQAVEGNAKLAAVE